MTEDGRPEALHRPGVREALNRYRRNALLIALAGCALFAAFVAGAVRSEDEAAELQRTGHRVPGEVVDVDPGFRTPGSIDVAFRYLDVARRAVIHLDSDSPDYEPGDAVVVVIDRDDHQRVTVVGEHNEPPGFVLPMVAALIGAVIAVPAGTTSLIRAHRQRKLLAAEPWRRTPVRFRIVQVGRGRRGVLLIERDGVAHLLLVPTTTKHRLRRAALSDRGQVDLVGDVGDRVVVRAPAGRLLITGEHPRRASTRRRWARRAFPDQYR